MGLPSRYRLEFDHISISLFLGGETIVYRERHNVYGVIKLINFYVAGMVEVPTLEIGDRFTTIWIDQHNS